MARATTTYTADDQAAGTVKWTSGVNLALGLWLIVAPFVLGYSALFGPLWNEIICGVIIAVLASIRLASPAHAEWASWINAGTGVWLIIAPFLFEPWAVSSMWNEVIVGAVVAILAAASGAAARRARVVPTTRDEHV